MATRREAACEPRREARGHMRAKETCHSIIKLLFFVPKGCGIMRAIERSVCAFDRTIDSDLSSELECRGSGRGTTGNQQTRASYEIKQITEPRIRSRERSVAAIECSIGEGSTMEFASAKYYCPYFVQGVFWGALVYSLHISYKLARYFNQHIRILFASIVVVFFISI